MTGKGKFVSAFKSMQMLGDYDNNNKETSSLDSSGGEDLYNPMEIIEQNNADLQFSNNADCSKGKDIVTEEKHLNDVCKVSFKEEKKTVFDDDDELLGTALAELEEEEREQEKLAQLAEQKKEEEETKLKKAQKKKSKERKREKDESKKHKKKKRISNRDNDDYATLKKESKKRKKAKHKRYLSDESEDYHRDLKLKCDSSSKAQKNDSTKRVDNNVESKHRKKKIRKRSRSPQKKNEIRKRKSSTHSEKISPHKKHRSDVNKSAKPSSNSKEKKSESKHCTAEINYVVEQPCHFQVMKTLSKPNYESKEIEHKRRSPEVCIDEKPEGSECVEAKVASADSNINGNTTDFFNILREKSNKTDKLDYVSLPDNSKFLENFMSRDQRSKDLDNTFMLQDRLKELTKISNSKHTAVEKANDNVKYPSSSVVKKENALSLSDYKKRKENALKSENVIDKMAVPVSSEPSSQTCAEIPFLFNSTDTEVKNKENPLNLIEIEDDRLSENSEPSVTDISFQDIMKSKSKEESKKHKKHSSSDESKKSTKEPKLVDYLVRQSQVEEEMKSVLKTYFKTREITKEEYKNILKKAVPQVAMSDSPIVPEKIHSLMTKFVRKYKGRRLRDEKSRIKQLELAEQQRDLEMQLQTNATIMSGFKQIRILNPNLPMPPVIDL